MTRLSICIATIDDRIEHLRLPEQQQPDSIEWIVIHQITDTTDYSAFYATHPHVQFHTMQGKGLSRSRNAALQLATGEWIYLCDDDITLSAELLSILESAAAHWPDAAILTFQLRTPGGAFFKNYPQAPMLHHQRSIGGVSSGEIILRKKAVDQGAVRFDERFGLGANFISGEEYLMLRHAMREGIPIAFYPAAIGTHPENSTGNNFTPALVQSKGAIIATTYGHACWMLNFLYAIRKHPVYRHQLGFFAFLKYIYSGSRAYFNGR